MFQKTGTTKPDSSRGENILTPVSIFLLTRPLMGDPQLTLGIKKPCGQPALPFLVFPRVCGTVSDVRIP